MLTVNIFMSKWQIEHRWKYATKISMLVSHETNGYLEN